MQTYPSAKSESYLQDNKSGQSNLTGRPYLSSHQVKGRGGNKVGSGMRQVQQGFGSGKGTGKEGMFRVTSLSTEDRVTAYLAAEGVGGAYQAAERVGGTGKQVGGKRGTSSEASKISKVKRRRI